MKKIIKLIFLVFLSFTTQAETVLYGQMQASLDYVRNGSAGTALQVASPLSFFGIRGREPISAGLSVVYDVQNTLSFSSQSAGRNQLAGRVASVGLEGRFGTLLFGKNLTPFRKMQVNFELFKRHALGDVSAFSRRPKDTTTLAWDRVAPDTLSYLTPKQWRQFRAQLMYKPDESDGSLQSDWLSSALFYKNRGWLLGIAYERQPEAVDNAGNAKRATGLRLGISYQRQSWRLLGFYQQTHFAEIDDQLYGLGGSYRRGKYTFKTHYFIADNELAERDATFFALGVARQFSKRTTLYLSYAVVNNQDQQNYSVISAGHGREGLPLPDLGGQSDAWSFGITQLF